MHSLQALRLQELTARLEARGLLEDVDLDLDIDGLDGGTHSIALSLTSLPVLVSKNALYGLCIQTRAACPSPSADPLPRASCQYS